MALALHGGSPLNRRTYEWKHAFDERETQAALEVLQSHVLSDFYGSPSDRFFGGRRVRSLEKKWAAYFGAKHAVSVNSATSGLVAAMGAVGIEPGDEVIVPPLTMSATAIAPLGFGGIPVFADLEPDCFCLDLASVASKVTPKTKAILAVNLFGQPANLIELRKFADERGLWLVEDNAQAPEGTLNGRPTGTIGHVGVFSLNCHKAIQCGEGGVCITDDDDLALRMQMIRNHGENVAGPFKAKSLANMVGQNFRMTELSAAIAEIQLEKLRGVNDWKIGMASYFDEKLKAFPFIQTPKVRAGARHVYYLYMLKFDSAKLPGGEAVHRDRFVAALKAEGFPVVAGYVEPLYRLPLFQKRTAIGSRGWPFISEDGTERASYANVRCEVAERLADRELFHPDMIRYRIEKRDVDLFADAVAKVAEHAKDLARA